jgi:pre-mRNA-splicing factor 38B
LKRPSQYYFETIFPRIPKKVTDDIVDELKKRGLPTTAKGNAGQVSILVKG